MEQMPVQSQPSLPEQLASGLIFDNQARPPINYGSNSETAADTLGLSEAVILTATFNRPLRSTSKVLVMATCLTRNNAAATKEIAHRIRRGSTASDTLVITQAAYMTADSSEVVSITLIAIDSPATTTAQTYALTGFTTTGSPTAENKSLVVIELPDLTKFP